MPVQPICRIHRCPEVEVLSFGHRLCHDLITGEEQPGLRILEQDMPGCVAGAVQDAEPPVFPLDPIAFDETSFDTGPLGLPILDRDPAQAIGLHRSKDRFRHPILTEESNRPVGAFPNHVGIPFDDIRISLVYPTLEIGSSVPERLDEPEMISVGVREHDALDLGDAIAKSFERSLEHSEPLGGAHAGVDQREGLTLYQIDFHPSRRRGRRGSRYGGLPCPGERELDLMNLWVIGNRITDQRSG